MDRWKLANVCFSLVALAPGKLRAQFLASLKQGIDVIFVS